MGHWSRHFDRRHWGRRANGRGVHWHEALTPGEVPGITPGGAGAFQLVLDGATVTYTWSTAVHKNHDGTEKRASLVDDPAVRYEGSALLLGDETRRALARLARFAAIGSSFLLGLPYEGLSLRLDSDTSTAYVHSAALAMADWALPGMYVIFRHTTYGARYGVIQSVGADSIVVSMDDGSGIGDEGKLGGEIMPAVAVYLDAQQGFLRHRTEAERWLIKARNANVGFSSSAVQARLALASPTTESVALQGAVIWAREAGAAGNSIEVEFVDDGSTLGTLDDTANDIVFHFDPDDTPAGIVATRFASSTQCTVTGASGITAITAAAVFGPTLLSGGADAVFATMGLGATLADFDGVPIWDRGVDVADTVTDSIQSMNAPQDMGGLPFTAQTADQEDWGRTIQYEAALGSEWQWVKKFLWTVKGRHTSFFLPTMREDLIATAVGTGYLRVAVGEENGDFTAWYPSRRTHIMCRLASGAVTYARISAVTTTSTYHELSLVDDADVAITLGAVPTLVSWMDPSRLESDEVTVQFRDGLFALAVQSRVMRNATSVNASTDFLEDESGAE